MLKCWLKMPKPTVNYLITIKGNNADVYAVATPLSCVYEICKIDTVM